MSDFYTKLKSMGSIGDYQKLEQEFQMKKAQAAQAQQLGDLQIQQLNQELARDPNAMSQKDKWDIILRQQELKQKGFGDALTTDPSGGMGGSGMYAPMDMSQFDDLTQSVMMAESGGNPNAVSPAGAQGLMQIMPDTARDPGYGVKPLQGWDGQNPMSAPPEEQMRFGQDYLNAMLEKNGGNKDLALASYNAGPGAVEKYGGVPPFKETQDYVQKLNPSTSAPSQGVKPLYQNGKPFTTGLNAGYQWAVDAQGNRVAMKVPGTAPTKDEMDLKKQSTAKVKLDDTLLELQDLYDQLAAEGQIRTETQGPYNNTLNYLANSNLLGQKAIAKASGNKSSTIREKIDAVKSRAAALYIDAAGLSSGQTNSLAEQERFLQSLGGYDKNYEANQQILQGLSNTYGAGNVTPRAYPTAKNGVVDYKEYFK